MKTWHVLFRPEAVRVVATDPYDPGTLTPIRPLANIDLLINPSYLADMCVYTCAVTVDDGGEVTVQ